MGRGDEQMRNDKLLIAVALAVLAAACSRTRAGETRSIAGEWRIAADPARVGVRERWCERDLPGAATLALPGTIAGLDDGPVWLQTSVIIPGSWKGKRVSLVLERASVPTRVWIDGEALPRQQDSLVTPQVHDLGRFGAPATRTLTVRLERPGGPGITELAPGLLGALELRAVDPVAFEDVQVFPDLHRKRVRVVARLVNATGTPAQAQIRLEVRPRPGGPAMAEAKVGAEVPVEGSFEAARELDLGASAQPWDGDRPMLYVLNAALNATCDGRSYSDETAVRFGLREVAGDPDRFTLNGQPFELGGTANSVLSPGRGAPSLSPGDWRRIFRHVKSRGQRSLRFEGWCPPEAAFAAADAEGVLLEVQAPSVNEEAEILRIFRNYGNHPSFCVMILGASPGEGQGGRSGLIERLRRQDRRRVYVERAQ
jgi:hypothetical protein